MPLYDFICEGCGIIEADVYQAADETHALNCSECGKPMGRIFGVPAIKTESGGSGRRSLLGFDPGLGCVVRSEAHRKEIMARRGLSVREQDSTEASALEDYKRAIKTKGAEAKAARKEIREKMVGAQEKASKEAIRKTLGKTDPAAFRA